MRQRRSNAANDCPCPGRYPDCVMASGEQKFDVHFRVKVTRKMARKDTMAQNIIGKNNKTLPDFLMKIGI